MSEGTDQTSTLHGQPDQDRLQPHSAAQQSGENFNGIGEGGSNDLGDFGKVAGGMNTDNGTGAGTADTAGSAAGATTGGGMEQEQPGYGSTGQQGYGDQSGAMGGSTGGQSGQMSQDGSAMSQQSGEETDLDGPKLFSGKGEDEDEDLGDRMSSPSAAGAAI